MALQPADLQPLDILNLRGHIEQQVREAILNGVFKPGERLVEMTIAEQLGVSRAPVRESLSALEREGIVTSIPRRGYWVVDFTDRDIEEIYSLRLLLEVGALERVIGNLSEQTLRELQEAVDALGTAIRQKEDYKTRAALDLSFHEILCRAAGHSRLYSAWNSMRLQTWLLIGLTSRTHYDRPARQEESHQDILDAIHAGQLDVASAYLSNHFLDAQQRVRRALTELRANDDSH
jgi:DNA-binding GntR family transcriptional regulator